MNSQVSKCSALRCMFDALIDLVWWLMQIVYLKVMCATCFPVYSRLVFFSCLSSIICVLRKHPILLHLFQAVYNDDGQFQGPGVRSQVPWFRTLPLQDHSGIPGGCLVFLPSKVFPHFCQKSKTILRQVLMFWVQRLRFAHTFLGDLKAVLSNAPPESSYYT